MKDESAQPTATPTPRGYPILAWMIILAVVGFILYRHAHQPAKDPATWQVQMQIQAKYLVGLHQAQLPGSKGSMLFEQFRDQIDKEPRDEYAYARQQRLAILAGELMDASEAVQILETLQRDQESQAISSTAEAIEQTTRLKQLYAAYAEGKAPALSDPQREALIDRLGWFGELAIGFEGGDLNLRSRLLSEARRVVVVYFALILASILSLFVGIGLWVAYVTFATTGRLGGLKNTGRGSIYVETFAAYFLLYVVLGLGVRALPKEWTDGLWLSAVTMTLSLLALAWPTLRGIPWSQVRQDLGIYWGEQPLLEILLGVGAYLAAVPVLIVGLVLLAILSRGQPTSSMPSHPLVGIATQKGWFIWVQVFVVACVLAPLVEEIMFRGALYRHLREVSGGWSRGLSVIASALASSFVFAVIHPQGWLGVPVLSGLALVFALAREWRGSLVSSMIAHALNNGMITLLLLVTS